MPKLTRLVLIGNQAFSMLNFRGPLIKALGIAGVEVFALAPNYTAAQRAEIRALGAKPVDYRMERNGINPISDSITLASLVSVLRRIKPDIALSYAIKPVIYGTLAAAIAGVPRRFALIEGLGHVFLGAPTLKGRLLKSVACRLYRAALSRAEETLFLNQDDRADFIALNLVDSNKAHVIGPIGVDLEKWKPVPPVLEPLTFLFVGRLLREKGICEFVEAARLVKAKDPRSHFIVLGDVDTNPSSVTPQQVRDWVEEGVIAWPGHVDVATWIANSSVFVLPSYREGVPRSTQEAMAMGRAVITTDVPGCRETVVDSVNGFLVPARNTRALATAMERFVATPTLAETMGRESLVIAQKKFSSREANFALIGKLIG